jgi:hypothetical protein
MNRDIDDVLGKRALVDRLTKRKRGTPAIFIGRVPLDGRARTYFY